MAFSIAAYAQGWSAADISAALSRDYLSRDTNRLDKLLTSGALSLKPIAGLYDSTGHP